MEDSCCSPSCKHVSSCCMKLAFWTSIGTTTTQQHAVWKVKKQFQTIIGTKRKQHLLLLFCSATAIIFVLFFVTLLFSNRSNFCLIFYHKYGFTLPGEKSLEVYTNYFVEFTILTLTPCIAQDVKRLYIILFTSSPVLSCSSSVVLDRLWRQAIPL